MEPWIPLLVVLMPALVALYVAWRGGRKLNSEAIGILSDAAIKQVQSYREEVRELRAELDTANEEIKIMRQRIGDLELQLAQIENQRGELRAGVAILSNQLKMMGYAPLYEPKP